VDKPVDKKSGTIFLCLLQVRVQKIMDMKKGKREKE